MLNKKLNLQIGKYECVEHIDTGGMGSVYLATDTELERPVALKLLHGPFHNSEAKEKFQREARLLATLEHTNIVKIYDSDLYGERAYIVMQYIDGDTLKKRLDMLRGNHKTMDVSEIRRILIAVFAALNYLHDNETVHRDLTPSNIILAKDGRIVLTDFGMAKQVGKTVRTYGTPFYVAPEQQADTRSDFYSLGVILFELLTGRGPDEAKTEAEKLAKALIPPWSNKSVLRDELPREVDSVWRRAMAENPDKRYQSVDEFETELMASLERRKGPKLQRIIFIAAVIITTITMFVIWGSGFGSNAFPSTITITTTSPTVDSFHTATLEPSHTSTAPILTYTPTSIPPIVTPTEPTNTPTWTGTPGPTATRTPTPAISSTSIRPMNTATPIGPINIPTGTNTPPPPTNTPTRTPTPTRTNTPTNLPTNTPTITPIPPTNTPIPPTLTPIPPTNTPVPPTNTPIPPTNTPVPPTDTPTPKHPSKTPKPMKTP
jgi:eukaryotic-like serine/threonine-protein kinase